jgi:hypothetical protein
VLDYDILGPRFCSYTRDLYSILWSFIVCDCGVGVTCADNLWLVLKLALGSAIWNCVVHVVSCERLVLLHWLCLSLSSLYLGRNIVFIRRFPCLGLTVVMVELSIFVFEVSCLCLLRSFNRVTI